MNLKQRCLLSAGLLTLTSCTTIPPRWSGTIFRGDPAAGAISRGPGLDAVACIDPKIHQYLCMSIEDFQRWVDTYVLGCVKWSKDEPMLSADDAKVLMQLYRSSHGF